jgi:hypothetical protein
MEKTTIISLLRQMFQSGVNLKSVQIDRYYPERHYPYLQIEPEDVMGKNYLSTYTKDLGVSKNRSCGGGLFYTKEHWSERRESYVFNQKCYETVNKDSFENSAKIYLITASANQAVITGERSLDSFSEESCINGPTYTKHFIKFMDNSFILDNQEYDDLINYWIECQAKQTTTQVLEKKATSLNSIVLSVESLQNNVAKIDSLNDFLDDSEKLKQLENFLSKINRLL